jgi:hypothetical protein
MSEINKMNPCEKWLKEQLKNGEPLLTNYIVNLAKSEGFKKAELKEARKALGVKTIHYPENSEAGINEHWAWVLPKIN